MAGNYLDAIGPRMAYDRDGTLSFKYLARDGNVGQMGNDALIRANDESGSQVGWGATEATVVYGFIFPQLRQITHLWGTINEFFGNTYVYIEVSNNTSTGLDGTWTNIGNFYYLRKNSPVPEYRTQVPTAITGAESIKAIRFTCPQGNNSAHHPQTLHVYGKILDSQSLDRVRLWHPTLDQDLGQTPAHLDWGDVGRGTQETRSFRVRNHSPTKTATNTVLSVEALTDTSPSLPPQFPLSLDNAAFTATVVMPTLGPGATSGLVYVKRSTPLDAALSIWACRIVAAPGSMT